MTNKDLRKGKIIVLSAPSGTGKSTIVGQLMAIPELNLEFSVSATSRAPRGDEQNGREYYFLTDDEFREHIDAGDFVEWEEVYKGTCYGTLASEVSRVTDKGKNLIMDIDVAGALNVKKRYGSDACIIFIMPPSIAELEKRLRNRATDNEDSIHKRLGKAEHEMQFAPKFDVRVVNDNLDQAVTEVKGIIESFVE